MKEKTKEFWREVTENKGIRRYGKNIELYLLFSSLWIGLITSSIWFPLLYLPINFMLMSLPKKYSNFWFRALIQTLAGCVVWMTTDVFPALFCFIFNNILEKSFRLAKSKKEWILGNLLPFFVLIVTEFLQGNLNSLFAQYYMGRTMAKVGAFTAFILFAVISWMFYAIFNNKKVSYCISISLFSLLAIVNFFVVAFTEQPFVLSDLKIATTAAGVLSEQQLTAGDWFRLIAGIVMIAGMFVAVFLVYGEKGKKRSLKRKLFIIPMFCLIIFSIMVGNKYFGDRVLLFRGNAKYGFIANFYYTANSRLDIPEDAKDYVIDDKNDELSSSPNVIIIMNEAFSDLGGLYDLTLNEDPLEYFRTLQAKYPNGVAYSSVKGNNTCSSEWELLSSTPTALTAKGATIYQDNAVPMRSLVSLFNSRGYTTIGLHPYSAPGYNRNNMYKVLGFDEAYFIEDLPKPIDKIRNYATDEYDYEQLIRLYEENENRGDSPFFCFNITMQNHGGYTSDSLDTIYRTEGTNYSDLNTYLSVLDKSDDALKTLISYFENVKEDTIILLFGDHQPLIDDAFYEEMMGKEMTEFTAEELMSVYNVPYLIWANYDLNEEEAPEEVSINYLANVLFNVGNIPKSTWLHMVDEWQKEYPIVTTNFVKDAKDNMNFSDVAFKSMPESLQKYQKYSYGVLYGIKN